MLRPYGFRFGIISLSRYGLTRHLMVTRWSNQGGRSIKDSNSKVRIAIIDEKNEVYSLFNEVLSDEHDLAHFRSTHSFLEEIQPERENAQFNLVVVDGCSDVTSFTEKVQQVQPGLGVIYLAEQADFNIALKMLRGGAEDLLIKPIRPEDIRSAIRRWTTVSLLSTENQLLRSELSDTTVLSDILGECSAIKELRKLIQRVAPSDASVLIRGESGSGKELVARAVHYASARADSPFITINCSAIPENLLESELFGHKKGSFTGASQDKKGLFVEADGGTLFLDEIGDMPLGLQAKLLRVLQDGRIRPVGEVRDRKINVRVVAASHRDFSEAIEQGKFRKDLYFRLSVVPLEVPPLRSRGDDIVLLANHFLKIESIRSGSSINAFSDHALKQLRNHVWPGNIRELKNTIQRAVVLNPRNSTTIDSFQFDDILHDDSIDTVEVPNRVPLKEVEKRYIAHILEETDGAKEEAAKLLGINRKTLYLKEKNYGLDQKVDG